MISRPARQPRSLAGAVGWLALLSSAANAAEPVSLQDIVEMRSIDSLLLSPDGRQIAYRVTSPSLAADRTMVAWYRVDLSGTVEPIKLGGDGLATYIPVFDILRDGQAAWAPDGHSLIVTAPGPDGIQLHRLGPAGLDEVLTTAPGDVLSLAPNHSRGGIDYQVGAPRDRIAAALVQERDQGIAFDRSVISEGLRLSDNFRVGDRLTTIRWTARGEAGEPSAGPVETKWLDLAGPGGDIGTPAVMSPTLSGDAVGQSLPLEKGRYQVGARPLPGAEDRLGHFIQVVATGMDRKIRVCEAPVCSGSSDAVRQLVIRRGSAEVVLLHEADYSGRTGLYGWTPETAAIRTIRPPIDSLDGGSAAGPSPCLATDALLLCVEAGPTSPPRLVRIDLASGATTTLADPNRLLAERRHASGDYLVWSDADGRTASGVLLMPRDVPGPVPLVITTYRCRGYLRGGTGAVSPEQLLVERGMAALCVNNNNEDVLSRTRGAGIAPVAPHLRTLASYRAIIAQLAGRGLVDPKRVGISGHSYSANVAALGLSQTDLFAAAVLGTGLTLDPATAFLATAPDPSWRGGIYPMLGLPHPLDDPDGLWDRWSPSRQARRIDAATLFQPPENEYLLALPLFAALQHAGVPSDLYVFPEEGHMVSRRPIHQLWRAQRSIDWFDYWLQDERRADRELTPQYAGWDRLRAAQANRRSPDRDTGLPGDERLGRTGSSNRPN